MSTKRINREVITEMREQGYTEDVALAMERELNATPDYTEAGSFVLDGKNEFQRLQERIQLQQTVDEMYMLAKVRDNEFTVSINQFTEEPQILVHYALGYNADATPFTTEIGTGFVKVNDYTAKTLMDIIGAEEAEVYAGSTDSLVELICNLLRWSQVKGHTFPVFVVKKNGYCNVKSFKVKPATVSTSQLHNF